MKCFSDYNCNPIVNNRLNVKSSVQSGGHLYIESTVLSFSEDLYIASCHYRLYSKPSLSVLKQTIRDWTKAWYFIFLLSYNHCPNRSEENMIKKN